MQKYFSIKSLQAPYNVYFMPEVLQSLNNTNIDHVIFSDDYFNQFSLEKKIVLIKAIESNKSLEKAIETIITLKHLNVIRNTHLFAIGGGVTQDLATFLSSVYMRGLKWSYIPTTLLAMVDSCIGGKSSINVAGYKNIVGNFNPPKNVFIDVVFLNTLSTNQIIEGLCEAAKITYAHSKKSFQKYLSNVNELDISKSDFKNIIWESLQAKKWFIEIDEFDKKERLLLNFGHTFGHALESASNYDISHGIAVGLGILVAVKVQEYSEPTFSIDSSSLSLLVSHLKVILVKIPDLHKKVMALNTKLIVEKFKADKKHAKDDYIIILPNAEGKLYLHKMKKNVNNDAIIEKSYTNLFKSLKQI